MKVDLTYCLRRFRLLSRVMPKLDHLKLNFTIIVWEHVSILKHSSLCIAVSHFSKQLLCVTAPQHALVPWQHSWRIIAWVQRSQNKRIRHKT